MRKLVLLYLALLLTAVACEDLRGLKTAGPMSRTDGVREDVVAEKLSDAALGTHDAITKAINKGKLTNAASLGFKLASGATSASATHGQMHNMEGGRHLLDRGPGMRSGSDGSRSDNVGEKMSDAALSTHAAILTASNKGKLANAASLGFKMAAAATNPSTTHADMHSMEAGARRLAAAGVSGGTYRSDVGAMDTALAASAAITKAVKAPALGSAKFATHVGLSEARVGSGASTHSGRMTDLAAEEHPVRHLLTNRDRAEVGALDTMNAASNAISKAVKTPTMGGAQYATAVGTRTSRVAGHTGVNVDLLTGMPLRHLAATAGGTYRPDAGAMDTALVTANVITKAVKAPALGSAKFATHVGVGEARVGSGAGRHSGFETDQTAEEHPVRHLMQGAGRGGTGTAAGAHNSINDGGALDTALVTSDAIAKAVKAPGKLNAKFATHVGISAAEVATSGPNHDLKKTDVAAKEHPMRRMLSNRDRSGVGALDTMNAASNAINKAVKTPSMGSAKFATTVGTRTSRVAGSAHSGFDVDVAAGGARRLLRQ